MEDKLSKTDEINVSTMRSRAAIRLYEKQVGLQPREAAALERVADEVRGEPILDLGVGAGRTVEPMLAISSDYLGIDYSPEMIATCRRRFPGVRFEQADARDLSIVPDGSIALAFFSCNGISMVDHEDRLRILREIHRVLRPGGIFVITTYNQNSDDESAGYRLPPFELTANPIRLLFRAAKFVVSSVLGYVNWLRYRRYSIRTPEYSMINDFCHEYRTMLYYISLQNQRLQLAGCGFEAGDAFDHSGRRIERDTRQNDYAMVARKPVRQVAVRRAVAHERRAEPAAPRQRPALPDAV